MQRGTLASPAATLHIAGMNRRMLAGAMGALFCAYALAFWISGAGLVHAITSAAVNVAAFGLSGLVMTGFVRLAGAITIDSVRGLVIHAAGAVAFAFLWYFLILAGFAIGGNWMRGGLVGRAFSENALVWQIFQGVTLYAVLVLWLERRLSPSVEVAGPSQPNSADPSAPLLIKVGDEIVAVDLDEIVQLSGADGYVEVTTPQRSFLTNRTLASLTETLPGNFLRVHRSHIVRRGAIMRAEPAGNGRLTLHLLDGKTVVTSREGARMIRGLSG